MAAPVVLVSNRGPLSFREDGDELIATRGGGGLVSGLAPLVAGTDTVWIAAALSDADRQAASRGVIEADGIRARTLAIDSTVMTQAYDGVCNSMLWFLYHGLHDLSRRPVIDKGFRVAWEAYRRYNRAFADVVADESPDGAVVLVQDYHLALLGPLLREKRPDLATVHFSHTPFAPPHLMRVLPHDLATELLVGMAGHNACGFHSDRWARDFRNSCEEIAGITPTTFVAPLAPDADDIRGVASSDRCQAETEAIDTDLGDRRLIVRVDRIELSADDFEAELVARLIEIGVAEHDESLCSTALERSGEVKRLGQAKVCRPERFCRSKIRCEAARVMERQVASSFPDGPWHCDIDVLNHIDYQSLWRPKTCRNGQRNAIDHEGLGFPRRLDAGGDQLVVGGLRVVADEGDSLDAVSLLGDVLLGLRHSVRAAARFSLKLVRG